MFVRAELKAAGEIYAGFSVRESMYVMTGAKTGTPRELQSALIQGWKVMEVTRGVWICFFFLLLLPLL